MQQQLCACVPQGEDRVFYMTLRHSQPGTAEVTSAEQMREGDRFSFVPVGSDERAYSVSSAEILEHKQVIDATVTRALVAGRYHLRTTEQRARLASESVRTKKQITKIETTQAGPIATVKVQGNVDIGNAARISSAIKQAAKEGDMILMDLTSVNTISSSGLGILITTYKECKAMSKDIKFLVDPQSYLVQAIALAHLDKVFALYTTREEAVEAFLIS